MMMNQQIKASKQMAFIKQETQLILNYEIGTNACVDIFKKKNRTIQ